jgi:hypothetical protein
MAYHHYCFLLTPLDYKLNGRPHPVRQINYTLTPGQFLQALPLPPLEQKLAKTSAKFSYEYTFKLTNLHLPQIWLNLHRQLMVASNGHGCI